MNRFPWRSITAAALLATGGLAGWGVAQNDARQAIQVPEARRAMMLAQMRRFLQSVNGVLNGAMAGDTAQMRAAAAAAGMAAMHQGQAGGMGPGPHAGVGPGMGQGMGPMMGGGMPAAFMQLGHATHNGFDDLAAAIARGAGRDSALTRLGELTAKCVSCHAAYKLEVR